MTRHFSRDAVLGYNLFNLYADFWLFAINTTNKLFSLWILLIYLFLFDNISFNSFFKASSKLLQSFLSCEMRIELVISYCFNDLSWKRTSSGSFRPNFPREFRITILLRIARFYVQEWQREHISVVSISWLRNGIEVLQVSSKSLSFRLSLVYHECRSGYKTSLY